MYNLKSTEKRQEIRKNVHLKTTVINLLLFRSLITYTIFIYLKTFYFNNNEVKVSGIRY